MEQILCQFELRKTDLEWTDSNKHYLELEISTSEIAEAKTQWIKQQYVKMNSENQLNSAYG